ncbi:MAG: WecB/TagA/CpsF family glycosyltransferase, partial [Chloroflexi bacterium]|nr:WecB/TagA/CpsF family glycosyltransferase [Chloroflexota bacterium]
GLRIAGAFAGDPTPAGDDAAIARVAAAGADILLIAYGMPKQERWLDRNARRLPGVIVAIAVGGTLDQLAGDVQPPPALVHALGFEWLWRLAREPWRWRRQLALVAFIARVLAARAGLRA